MNQSIFETNVTVRVIVDEGDTSKDWGILTIECDDEKFIALLKRTSISKAIDISKSRIRIPIIPKDGDN